MPRSSTGHRRMSTWRSAGARSPRSSDLTPRPASRRASLRSSLPSLPDRRLVIGAVLVVLVGAGVGGYVYVVGRVPTPTSVGPPPHFVDETASSGLVHTYDGGLEFAVGGGLAV